MQMTSDDHHCVALNSLAVSKLQSDPIIQSKMSLKRLNLVPDIQLCGSESCRQGKNTLAHSFYVFHEAVKSMHSWNILSTYVPPTCADTHNCHFS